MERLQWKNLKRTDLVRHMDNSATRSMVLINCPKQVTVKRPTTGIGSL